MPPSKHILPVIVFAQFCCTSLWFAGNGVILDLIESFGLAGNSLGHLTAAVQLGFILGTLVFAVLTISDRFSPSKVFFCSALIGGLFNLAVVWQGNTQTSLLVLRFVTGFCLAGIYPVGMKIAADYFDKSLGKSLGYLVGALVLGTAFPHLLKGISGNLPWKVVLYATSCLALVGGVLMILLVPNGPYRKQGEGFDFSAFWTIFKIKKFRTAAFGYFGHMWELYAFWAFVPLMLVAFSSRHAGVAFNVPIVSFLVIAGGGLACVVGGYLANKSDPKKVAMSALFLSAGCCLASPLMFFVASPILFVVFLCFWGAVVVADSPLFSTLVAQNAKAEIRGTALTIVNSIGFSVTIVSIQLLNAASQKFDSTAIYSVLALGPILGLVALRRD